MSECVEGMCVVWVRISAWIVNTGQWQPPI